MPDKINSPRIYVLAGTNGAGKSSVEGATFLASGSAYFNPDETARQILSLNPGITMTEANGAAWQEGRRLLETAISERLDFAFETTLGGNTMTALLEKASAEGINVCIWYVGLASPELHIARVAARVAKGGHPIPDQKIRERFDQSRGNLIRLLPSLTDLRLYDNSADSDPDSGITPQPQLLLHMIQGTVVSTCDLYSTPDWAKPILAVALREID